MDNKQIYDNLDEIEKGIRTHKNIEDIEQVNDLINNILFSYNSLNLDNTSYEDLMK
jgi:regulator of replication initiation timing